MTDTDAELAALVASTARALVATGLIEAFGHVSARRRGALGSDDPGLLITPTTPLGQIDAGDVVRVDGTGDVSPPGAPAPLEVALHRAVYRARPDVQAICRGHGPAMVAWGTRPRSLPVRHGLGLLAGAEVRVHAEVDLVTDAAAGDDVAATLGSDHCVLLLGNGGLATGADLLEAATRLWFLEERARVALDAPAEPASPAGASPGDATLEDPAARVWRRRARHSDVELRRAMAWFATTHLDRSPTDHTHPADHDRPSTDATDRPPHPEEPA